jgi:hypothetical protein
MAGVLRSNGCTRSMQMLWRMWGAHRLGNLSRHAVPTQHKVYSHRVACQASGPTSRRVASARPFGRVVEGRFRWCDSQRG